MSEAETVLSTVYLFPSKKVSETLKNGVLSAKLVSLAAEAGLTASEAEERKVESGLLYELATQSGAWEAHRGRVVQSIAAKEIRSKVQLSGALQYLSSVRDDVDEAAYRAAAGVGVEFTPDDVARKVRAAMEDSNAALNLDGAKWSARAPLLAQLRESELKFADARILMTSVDAELERRYGPKGTQAKGDVAAAPKNTTHKLKNRDLGIGQMQKAKSGEEPKSAATEETDRITLDESIVFHRPEENVQRTPELLEAHLLATGGKVVTRFPPEPNGYLHIGHAKSMNLNFGYARRHGGVTYLRFDDTNPEAESEEYVQSIQEDVQWLGHRWHKLTHASDYFGPMLAMAEQLIRQGDAYVCHQTSAEMKADRDEMRRTHLPKASPWRDRPAAESLALFADMQAGKLREGEATLRLRMDLSSPNPVMWDPVAYRIKYHPHPMTGTTYCVYPSYDYTHCINDSLENITHSLCTLEFTVRRQSYAWLLDRLGLYKPPQWEFSRLNVTYMVMSKRKLLKLVTEGHVRGWDDPRMLTLRGMRRRGFTPSAINLFCERIGVTRSRNFQRMEALEECAREVLDKAAIRAMVVLRPLRVELTNVAEGEVELLKVPNHPTRPELGSHEVRLARVLYVERDDFRVDQDPHFFRMAPGREVRLRYAHVIRCDSFSRAEDGSVDCVQATLLRGSTSKPKGVLHWASLPVSVEVRLYDRLFLSEYPEGISEVKATKKADVAAEASEACSPTPPLKKRDFLDDLNPASLTVIQSAYVDQASLLDLKVYDSLQFERHGYFCVDKDSTPERFVFNRTVTLKEDRLKN